MPGKVRPAKVAATGRLDRWGDRADGACVIHNWMPDGFVHDTSGVCLCGAAHIASDDPRSLDEIMDDLEEQEREGARAH